MNDLEAYFLSFDRLAMYDKMPVNIVRRCDIKYLEVSDEMLVSNRPKRSGIVVVPSWNHSDDISVLSVQSDFPETRPPTRVSKSSPKSAAQDKRNRQYQEKAKVLSRLPLQLHRFESSDDFYNELTREGWSRIEGDEVCQLVKGNHWWTNEFMYVAPWAPTECKFNLRFDVICYTIT